MNISEWMMINIKLLKISSGTPRLDAEVLLGSALNKTRAWLLANPDFELSVSAVKKLEKQVVRRLSHEPIAYILGKTEFYGREFFVDKNVLVPRPESETMIGLLGHCISQHVLKNVTIVDVGTGSGALAITAKLEMPKLEVMGGDIDQKCLKVARKNAERHKVNVDFIKGDLLSKMNNRLENCSQLIILANLPYVPDSHTINEAAMSEPKRAIFGGPDGLDLYRKLFVQISDLISSTCLILTESLSFQHAELEKIASLVGFRQIAEEDFIQVFSRN